LVYAGHTSAGHGTRSTREIQVESSPGKGRRRVLIVEDDDAVASMLSICLAAGGFDVARVALGADALGMLACEPVSAVILDLSLPDGLGGSVLGWLRRVSGHATPPYLVISALEQGEVTKQYGPVGTNFVPKPFDPWVLVGKLEELLEEQSPRRWKGSQDDPHP
jgi:DNA-binding response OmpR family regulator